MKTNLVFAFAIFAITASLGFASADMDGGMSNMMYGTYGYPGLLLGWLFAILTIALIIAAIYWLVKSANKTERKR